MTEPESSVTVRMPATILWLLRLGPVVLGLVLGFFVKPLVRWITETMGDAPGPLRVMAAMPTTVGAVVLAVVGCGVGIWMTGTAWRESLLLRIGSAGILLAQDGSERYIPRDSVGAAFRDRRDLVLLDPETRQLARHDASDLSIGAVRAAFERFDYPWRGGADPYEREFRRWIDGHPSLDGRSHRLLRERKRALQDKKVGTAAELAEELQTDGLIVRDRDGVQQYRHVPTNATT